MKNLVGQTAITAEHQLNILADLPKKYWASGFADNKSICKVYQASTNGILAQIPHHNTTFEFRKYLTQLKKNVKLTNFTTKFGNFDEMIEYGYEGNISNCFKTPHITESVVKFNIGDVSLALVPWNDGVMVQSIVVPTSQRNNGAGTKIMNILYDISENTNIPLYLIPYPSERFNPNEEYELVCKLEAWYRGLGFDKMENTINDTKVWCNMY